MAVQTIEIKKTFPFSLEKLFAHMSEHENLASLFAPMKVVRVRNGDTERNGVGSVRQLGLPLPLAAPFEETVTAFEADKLIEYRISRGSPLRNHHGCMRFSGDENSAKLHYTISFEGKFPGVAAIIKPVLQQGINRGLDRLKL